MAALWPPAISQVPTRASDPLEELPSGCLGAAAGSAEPGAARRQNAATARPATVAATSASAC